MLETIPVLLEAGAVVDQVSNDGETALWRAAASGQVGAIEALLQAGADINHAANNGLTPLAAARAKHHEAAALALVEGGRHKVTYTVAVHPARTSRCHIDETLPHRRVQRTVLRRTGLRAEAGVAD